MTPGESLANVVSRGEATRNLLNNDDLRFLADARNDKILYFAGFIFYSLKTGQRAQRGGKQRFWVHIGTP